MNDRMKGILSRLLSEEIANQTIWEEYEMRQGIPTNRSSVRQEIMQFMTQNKIAFNKTYYLITMEINERR